MYILLPPYKMHTCCAYPQLPSTVGRVHLALSVSLHISGQSLSLLRNILPSPIVLQVFLVCTVKSLDKDLRTLRPGLHPRFPGSEPPSWSGPWVPGLRFLPPLVTHMCRAPTVSHRWCTTGPGIWASLSLERQLQVSANARVSYTQVTMWEFRDPEGNACSRAAGEQSRKLIQRPSCCPLETS